MSILTKIFVLLQLVFALVLAVLVVLFVHGQQNYKKQVLTDQNTMIAAQAALLNEETTASRLSAQLAQATRANINTLGSLNSKILRLQGNLASAQSEIAQLKANKQSLVNSTSLLSAANRSQQDQLAAETKELTKLRPVVLRYVNENAQLNRHNTQLTNERNEAQKEIQTLQESIVALNTRLARAVAMEHKAASTSSQNVANAVIGVPTAAPVNGKIQQVQTYNSRTYVSVNLGSRDGVSKGTRLTVYSKGKYVADVVVRSVDPTTSVGVVTLASPSAKVVVNDLVMSGPGT